jgi:hypothetical protein
MNRLIIEQHEQVVANLVESASIRAVERKKAENQKVAVALQFASYNFYRKHMILGVTPAMAAGIAEMPWNVRDLTRGDGLLSS